MTDPRLDDIDPATVRAVRAGNALWPGLAAFTGVSFLAYLLVKAFAGTLSVGPGLYGQLALSAVLLAVGGRALARGRYFFVVVETAAGARRISGLSKSEQGAIAESLSPKG